MNDFTKEELLFLSKEVDDICNEYRFRIMDERHIFVNDLRKKIIKMIENYCEHELNKAIVMVNRCYECDKCEIIYE